VPIISSGFFSKDEIVAQTVATGHNWLGGVLIFTALLTAYYCFRVWFRVCAGPVQFEMGDEHHGADDHHDHVKGQAKHKAHHSPAHHTNEPHPPRFAINFVLLVITIGAVASIFLGGWVRSMIEGSTASGGLPHELHGEHADFWSNTHAWMPWVAGAVALIGIAIAAYFHLLNRRGADALRARLLANPATRWLPTAMENKWYVDELYDWIIRRPLWVLGLAFNLFDRYIIDMLIVDGIARVPKWMGRSFQPLQNGLLQSYAVSMAGGVGLAVLLVVVVMPYLRPWLLSMFGGGG
jgi:NADH-quinone oxidoreductase subunit L